MMEQSNKPIAKTKRNDQCSNFIDLHYLVSGDIDDAWSRLKSLKAFDQADRTLGLIDVIQLKDKQCRVHKAVFSEECSLNDYLAKMPIEMGTRYISLFQKNSWASLGISESMLAALMYKHAVMPEFLELVSCFRDKTCDIEEGFGGATWKRSTIHATELAFIFKYPENNGRHDGLDAWSIRQTGVYQSFKWSEKASLWLLLHPRKDTAAHTRMERLLSAKDSSYDFQQQPPLLGLIIISTYVGNWRDLMAYYEQEELRMSAIVISAELHERLHFSHSTLSKLRRLENRLLLLRPIFRSLRRTIDDLDAFAGTFQAAESPFFDIETYRATKEILANYKNMTEEYGQNATFLINKVRASAQLLLDTLNLKHQRIAQRTSENTLAINNSAANDSATIRVITIVTLLYLPATFVATLFGMQLFATDSSGKTTSSPQLWIFFALAAPFTVATFAYWKWMDWKQRRKEKDVELELE